MKEIAPGIHRWTARHPDWHPSRDDFGKEVASYALTTEGGPLLLIDPLVLDDAQTAAVDALAEAASDTYIFITIGYHVRSAPTLAARYGAAVHGPPQAGKRLKGAKGAKGASFSVLEPGTPGPAGVAAHAIGNPRRGETPLHFPTHGALAFGDALVATPEGELRMWCQDPDDPSRHVFYRERFAPTLDPLVALAPEHVLVTHGEPVLGDGAAALRAAAAAGPWFHGG